MRSLSGGSNRYTSYIYSLEICLFGGGVGFVCGHKGGENGLAGGTFGSHLRTVVLLGRNIAS